MPPRIFTLTGNLLWEKTLTFAEWQPGKTQRAQSASFQVGGKGINVSRMLARFGVSTKALCFAGGGTGQDCAEWLRARSLDHRIFATQASTRAGFVVRGAGQAETTFLGPDVVPEPEAFLACARALSELAAERPPTVLALCGSFPGWTTDAAAPLKQALVKWQTHAPLVVDTYGPALNWAVEQPLPLIKINRVEFDALFSEPEKSLPIATRLERASDRWPVRSWIVSDGPGEVWFREASAPAEKRLPPSIEEISATGSGDVLFAALLHARYHRGLSLRDALDYALPYASANAASEGIAEFDLNNLPARRSLRE